MSTASSSSRWAARAASSSGRIVRSRPARTASSISARTAGRCAGSMQLQAASRPRAGSDSNQSATSGRMQRMQRFAKGARRALLQQHGEGFVALGGRGGTGRRCLSRSSPRGSPVRPCSGRPILDVDAPVHPLWRRCRGPLPRRAGVPERRGRAGTLPEELHEGAGGRDRPDGGNQERSRRRPVGKHGRGDEPDRRHPPPSQARPRSGALPPAAASASLSSPGVVGPSARHPGTRGARRGLRGPGRPRALARDRSPP